jgi:hypothetical protein
MSPSLNMIKPSQTVLDQLLLSWCHLKFIPYIIISDLISSCVAAYPTQYLYFSYTHLLDVLSFYNPTLCVIYYRGANRCPVELVFNLFGTYHMFVSIFTHPAFILWLICSSIALSFCNIDFKYQNMSFLGTTCPSKPTSSSSELSSLNWHLIYSILVLLCLKLFDSKIYLHNSSFLSTLILLSSISIASSTKSMNQGTSLYMSFMISSITKVKIYRLNTDP